MTLTRIDSHFYRGRKARADLSSFVAINPDQKPGSMVVASAAAVREGLGSQVGCKLALEHFVDGVLDFFESKKGAHHGLKEISVEILEAAFRKANLSVYEFGHKLQAGGRLAASMIGVVIEDSVVAAGRVGEGSAYLVRKKEVFPFFDPESDQSSGESVGVNSLVTVELASISILDHDLLFVFSRKLTPAEEALLSDAAAEFSSLEMPNIDELMLQLFLHPEDVPFAMLAKIGPQTIYLDLDRAVQTEQYTPGETN